MAKPPGTPKPPPPPPLPPLRSCPPGDPQQPQPLAKYTVRAAGNSSNLCSSRVGEKDDKSSTAKLFPGFTADEMQVNPNNADSSLTHVKQQRSWLSVQAFVVEHITSKGLGFGWEIEAVDGDLRDIVLSSLHAFFKTAVEMISHEGYTEDAVIHAIRDSALCYQFDGPITKIADSARALLKSGRQVDSSPSENLDLDLHMLGLYILSCTSRLLKKYLPSFTWGEALWCILLCDLDISIAHIFSIAKSASENEESERLVMNNQNVNEPSGGASESPGGTALSRSEQVELCRAELSRSPQRLWGDVLTDYIRILKSAEKDQVSSSGQDHVASSGQVASNVVTSRKQAAKGASSKRTLKETRSMNAFLESASSTSTGTSKVANTKGLKSSTSFSIMPPPNHSLVKQIDAPTVVSTPPRPSRSSSSGKSVINQQADPDGLVCFSLPNTPADGFEFEFSLDGMQTSWVPKDKKEELVLCLIKRLGELKLKFKLHTYLASVMLGQSARRLAIEKPVLASLKKEMTKLEEWGMLYREKLEETQTAIDCANSLALELTDKIELSKVERDSAKLQEKQSIASLADMLKKEHESLESRKSFERETNLLQAELDAQRSNLCKLMKNLEQAKGYEDILKKRHEEGEKMIDEAVKQVNLARNELEQIEISARIESSNILVNAENENQKLQASAKDLRQQIKSLQFDLASGSKLQRVARYMGPPGFVPDSVWHEHECLVCMDEEISVVFLPCGHQVVCISCNQLLEDKGITNCPTCRLTIERRICARFADN